MLIRNGCTNEFRVNSHHSLNVSSYEKASPRVASFPVRGGAPGNEATPREDCAKIFNVRFQGTTFVLSQKPVRP